MHSVKPTQFERSKDLKLNIDNSPKDPLIFRQKNYTICLFQFLLFFLFTLKATSLYNKPKQLIWLFQYFVLSYTYSSFNYVIGISYNHFIYNFFLLLSQIRNLLIFILGVFLYFGWEIKCCSFVTPMAVRRFVLPFFLLSKTKTPYISFHFNNCVCVCFAIVIYYFSFQPFIT